MLPNDYGTRVWYDRAIAGEEERARRCKAEFAVATHAGRWGVAEAMRKEALEASDNVREYRRKRNALGLDA